MNFRQLFENKTPITDYDTWRDQVDAQGGEVHPQRDRVHLVAQSWSGEIMGEFNLRTGQGWITAGEQGVAEGFDELDAYMKAKLAPKPRGDAGIKRGSYGTGERKSGYSGKRVGLNPTGTGSAIPSNRGFGRPHSIPRSAPRGIDDYDANYRREVDENNQDMAQAKERLAYLEKILDPSYEYSDDHSVWKKNHAIEQEIRQLRKIVGQGVPEAVGDLGSKRDRGKSVRKWRKQRGLDEQGVVEDWQKANKQDKTDGMSSKAVKAYRRENPGSKLKTAVTTKPSKLKKGSKAAKRRKSFCARMSGMKKAHASAKTKRNPDSPINKALRRWNCESIEEMQNLAVIAEQKIALLKQQMSEGEYKDTVDKSKIPAVQRKAQGGDWKVSTKDLEHERSKSPTGAEGLAKAKQRLDVNENLQQLPPEVVDLIKKIAQSDAAPEHKAAIIKSIMAKYQPVKDIAEEPKQTAREKFNQGLKRAGFDPDAAAKRLTDLIAKQKAERERFEKENPAVYGDDKEVKEEKVRLDPRCWSGKKIGNPKTKVKGGVRVNNCVPK